MPLELSHPFSVTKLHVSPGRPRQNRVLHRLVTVYESNEAYAIIEHSLFDPRRQQMDILTNALPKYMQIAELLRKRIRDAFGGQAIAFLQTKLL